MMTKQGAKWKDDDRARGKQDDDDRTGGKWKAGDKGVGLLMVEV